MYVSYNTTKTYSSRSGTVTQSIPSTNPPSGKVFDGWYTASSNGLKVIDSAGNIQSNMSNWTNSSRQWILTNVSGGGTEALSGVAAISLLMIAVIGIMTLTDKMPKSSVASFAIFCVGLLAVIGIMYLLFMAINELKDVEHAAVVLTMITIFMVAMAGVVAILSVVGVGAVAALASIGVIAVLVAAVTAIILLLGALYDYKGMLENGIEILKMLLVGVGEAIAGFVGAVFIKLAQDLSTFGEELARPKGFIESMKKLDGDILKGVGVLTASVIALTVASFINGINNLFALFTGKSSLIVLAEDLSSFAKIIGGKDGFLTIMSTFPEGAARGVKSLSEAFLYLTAGSFLNGLNNIFSMFTGGAFSLEQFGKDISTLGSSLSNFIQGLLGPIMSAQLQMVGLGQATGSDELADNAMNGINSYVDTMVKVVEAGANAIKKLAEAQEALPRRGGVRTTFSGSVQTLNEFADGFKDLAKPLTDFSSALIKVKFGDEQIKVVSAASESIKNLAEAADALPNDGSGILSSWTGKKQTLQSFTAQFPSMADSIIKFTVALTTKPDGTKYDWSTDAANAARVASDTVKAMAEAAGYVAENTGKTVEKESYKLFDFITIWSSTKETWHEGSETLAQFADNFPAVGESLRRMAMILLGEEYFYASNLDTSVKPYQENLDGITKIIPLYTSLMNAINDLATASASDWMMRGLESLPDKLGKVGPALAAIIEEFKNNVYNDPNTDFESLKQKIQNAGSLFTTFNTYFNKDLKDSAISEFGKNILMLAGMKDIKPDFTYIRTVIESLKEFTANTLESFDSEYITERLIKLGEVFTLFKNNLTTDSYKPLKDFLDGFTNIGKDALVKLQSGFCDEITSNNGYSSMAAALSNFFTNIRGEAEKDRTDPVTSIKAKGEELGKDLLEGYINGLENSVLIQKVYANAKSISQKAVQGIADGQNSNSPSKESMKLGTYLDQGFIIGINELKDKVYDSSFGIGRVATSGLSNSISRIADMVNSDIDANPTIRPVLDLSNVQDGANAINSMFANPSVGLLNNLSSIGYGMNSRIQNGGNNEVVSAIDKLSRTLSNSPSNTYNINGISYNDDSNINNAVRDLINAIEVERRV